MRIADVPDSISKIPVSRRPWWKKPRTLPLPKVAGRQKRSDQKGITQLVQAVRKEGLSARKATRLVTGIISQMEAALVDREDVEVPGGKISVLAVKGEARKTHFLHTNLDGTQQQRIHRYPGRRSVIKFRSGAVIDDPWPANTPQPLLPRVDVESQALVLEIKARLMAISGAAPTNELLSTLRKMFRNDYRPLHCIRDILLFIQQTGVSYEATSLPGAIRMVEEMEIWSGRLFGKDFEKTLWPALGNSLKDAPDPLRTLRDELHYLNQLGPAYDPATLPQLLGSSQSFELSLAEYLNDGPADLNFRGKVLSRFRREKNPTASLQRYLRMLPLGGTFSQSTFLEALTKIEAIEKVIYKLLDNVPAHPDFMERALKSVKANMTGSKPVLSVLHHCLDRILLRCHVYGQDVLLGEIRCFKYDDFAFNR